MKTVKKFFAGIICTAIILSMCACGGTTAPAPATSPEVDTNTVQMPEGSTFSVQFFDVGNAESALVECDGKYMLIDGGNKADSQKMYTILKEKNIPHLEYIVATNTSVEHIGGLAGALNYATAGTVFCPTYSEATDAFNDFKKYADKNGGGITVPKAGNKYMLGVAEMEFVAVTGAPDVDTSIIVKITYGNTSFVFAGNDHIMTEQIAVSGNTDLKATVLKVADSGSDNATTTEFFREVNPQYAVISTSGKDNCPGKTTVSIMEVAVVNLYRTDLHGDVCCTSDGNTVTFTTEKEADADKLFGAGTAAEPDTTQKPAATAKPTAAPAPTPVTTSEPEQKPVSPVGLDELYEANLITNLVNAYGSVKTVDHYMQATFINGYFKVGDGYANLRTGIDTVTGNCTYNGWYNGYNFYDNGTRVVQQVFAEELDGDSIVPGQQDLAHYFMNLEDVEYIGRNGKDYIFESNIYASPYTLTVDGQSLAVKKVEWDTNPGTDKMEYIYGEWVEGQDILNAWTMDGSPMKMVNVYVDLYDGTEHISLYRPFYIPASWELEIDSMVQQVYTYMDANYTQPYVYPGDEAGYYDLYVTNAVG